jgi:hypothetical protein
MVSAVRSWSDESATTTRVVARASVWKWSRNRRDGAIAAFTLALVVAAGTTSPSARADEPAQRGPSSAVLRILVRLAAKESCTCLYVHDGDEKTCQAFIQRHAPMVSWTASAADKQTEARLAGLTAHARWRDPQTGCVLAD